MDLTKTYFDSEGLSGNILQIVRREPEWAAERIQEGEKAIAELRKFTGPPTGTGISDNKANAKASQG
jgi:hypothetical protein